MNGTAVKLKETFQRRSIKSLSDISICNLIKHKGNQFYS